MKQTNYQLIERLASYTSAKAIEDNNPSLFFGKSGSAVALFETAVFLGSEETEDIAVRLMEQVLSCKTENIRFSDGSSGIGYALLYLMKHQYIENDIDKYFGKNRKVINCTLSRHIKQQEAETSSSLEILNYLVSILLVHPEGNEKLLSEIIIDRAFRQLTYQFDIDHWFKGHHCKPAVIDTFITLLKGIARIKENGLQHLYDPDLFKKLHEAYASLYHSGYIAHYYMIGYYLDKVAGKYTFTNDIAQNNCNKAIRGIQTRYLSLRKKRELFFFLPKDEFRKTLLETIGYSLEVQLEKADEQSFSCLTYDITHGTSAWLLHEMYKENLRHNKDNTRFFHLIF